MANVNLREPLWPDATAAGVDRMARNCAVGPGSMDSIPTATVDTAGAFMYLPGATTVPDVMAMGYKNASDAYVNGYIAPAFSKYGVGLSGQFVYQSASFTLANGTSAQSPFTAAQDTFTAEADTTYWFEAYLSLTTGATTHITSTLFGGTATLTSIAYHATSSSSAAGTLAAAQMVEIEAATAVAVTATSTAVRTKILLKGSVQINAAGTFIPQIQFSADPTGTCTTNIGSYFLLIPIGSKTVTSSGFGRWA